jgi:TPR repeat protein
MFESKAKVNMWVECGDDYYFGREGEKVDCEMAAIFYYKAMKKKHPRATYMLGLCHELGRGVDKDIEYADILYERAAGYGDENAKRRLASGKLPDSHEAAAINNESTQQSTLRSVAQYKQITPELLKVKIKEHADTFDALALSLLLIRISRGAGSLYDENVVRAYLSDLLPLTSEIRDLAAFLYRTKAIGLLSDEEVNRTEAVEKLTDAGVGLYEAEMLIRCFTDVIATDI